MLSHDALLFLLGLTLGVLIVALGVGLLAGWLISRMLALLDRVPTGGSSHESR